MREGDNDINNYTAADIEKYHKGLLSASAMHAMEKSAMDDPFLSDALEGYKEENNIAGNVANLKERLATRIGSAKVIPIETRLGGSKFNMLRAAVVLVFIAGAGLLIYQFGFNKKNDGLAEVKIEPRKPEQSVVADSTKSFKADSESVPGLTATPVTNKNITQVETETIDKSKDITSNIPKQIKQDPKQVNTERGFDIGTVSKEVEQPVVKSNPLPPVTTRSADDRLDKPGVAGGKAEDKKELAKDTRRERSLEEVNTDETRDQSSKTKNTGQSRSADNDQQASNQFRGRVTDVSNVGVPFANVSTLTDNNRGTYTDAKGYFNLIYPDSVLNVEVRSIGFENMNAQLRNSVPNNQVVLKNDRSTVPDVVLNNKTNSAERKTPEKIKSEESEPVDGWEKYDAYLLNNLNKSQAKKSEKGNVEVSFEVNRNGYPINLKIEKSLCKSCDKEAIRLVKEGPKWKRNGGKVRTTVKVPF